MVGAAAIAELDVFQVIVDAVLMHVVEIGHATIGPLERYLADLEPVALDHQLGVLIGFPIDIIAEIEAAYVDLEQRLVARILPGYHVLGGEAFASDEEIPLVATREMLEPVAIAHLREIVHRELTAEIEVAMLTPDDERDLVLRGDAY